MYDISSVEESNGKVTVYALPDEKETRLLAAFNAGGKHQPANPFHNPRIGFLAYYPLKTVDPLPEACSCRIELFIKSSPVIPDPFILIFSPPPELLS